MSRQAQSILTGAVACLVAATAVAAVIMSVARDNNQATTASVDPLSSGGGSAQVADDGSGSGAELDQASDAGLGAGLEDDDVGFTGSEEAVPPRTIPVRPEALAVTVAVTPDSAVTGADSTTATIASTSTTAPSSSAAPASTVANTAPSNTTPSNTTPPNTTPSTAAPTTAASSTTTTARPSSSSTATTSGSTATTARDTTTTTARTTTTVTTASTTTTTRPPADTTTTTRAPSGGSMNAIEREIARLTNELRTNPNGPLKREGPAIDCNGRVRVNLSTGVYESIGAVTISETASLQVARPWSAQMTRDNFEHQPNAGVPALQAAGISVRSAGENIAYHNYPDKAMFHFTGWRESDGHFCNMMNPGFTHLGVGEVTKSDGISYATQNFYSTR